jgi:hypothetical protein
MRLRAWCKRRGKGAIAQLVRATGISYPTIHAYAHDKQVARRHNAKKVSAATGGAVSIDELEELPTPKPAKQASRRRKSKRRRSAPAAAFMPAAHG